MSRNGAADEQTREILRKAILHVAAKRGCSRLALGLLIHLPEMVAAGRYLDGWLGVWVSGAAVGV